jgi:hypothetical protein
MEKSSFARGLFKLDVQDVTDTAQVLDTMYNWAAPGNLSQLHFHLDRLSAGQRESSLSGLSATTTYAG